MPGILNSVPSPKRSGEGDTFHFPAIMLNIITRSNVPGFTVQRFRCSVSDSLAILRQAQDGVCPEYKVVTCRIQKAKKAHLRKAGEMVEKG